MSAPDASTRIARTPQRFGTIVVVGGGCYGGYYVRQLRRAQRASAILWDRLIVVDRDPDCAVAALPVSNRPPGMEVVVDRWDTFMACFLDRAADNPDAGTADAIVPSPLMPHLMAEWLLARAADRWPRRTLASAPLGGVPPVPWQRTGEDGTHYVSFAEWM